MTVEHAGARIAAPGLTRRAALAALAAPLLMAASAVPATPMRLLVIGDSQAQGLAAGLQRTFRGDRDLHVLDHSRIGSGLIIHQVYDWPAQARVLAQSEKPDVTVVMFGANDRPPVRIGGKVNPTLAAQFQETYGGHVRTIVAALHQSAPSQPAVSPPALSQPGAAVIWVGHPIVREPDYAEDMRFLNTIYQTNTIAAGGDWMSSWEMFLGPDGGYAAYGPGPDGSTTRLRADDGIHLTPAGYDIIARAVRPRILEHRQAPPAD
jgi:hypothetical protein